jgi:RNA polymerase sigma-70 factor, ECF subfamily
MDVEAMYRTFGPSVLRRARALLGEEQAARDAMQEVFVRALRSRSEFRAEASPMTWLYRVTTNYCLNLMRDRARRTELLAQEGPPPQESPRAPVDERLTLRRLVASMPAELQEIAVYHYVDQMSHDEIAALTGMSRRTVGNRIEAFRSTARAAAGEAGDAS